MLAKRIYAFNTEIIPCLEETTVKFCLFEI